MDVIVQNGQFYEAKLPVQHCPSNTGCRSVVRQANGNSIFQLNENFVITLKVWSSVLQNLPFRKVFNRVTTIFWFQEPNHKSIWLHYILVIPSSLYKSNIIHELPFDQTARFISQCGQNSFYLDTNEEGMGSCFLVSRKVLLIFFFGVGGIARNWNKLELCSLFAPWFRNLLLSLCATGSSTMDTARQCSHFFMESIVQRLSRNNSQLIFFSSNATGKATL